MADGSSGLRHAFVTVPLVLHLAAQDATGITGRMFDVMKWNVEHGLGGHETWADKSFSYDALVSG